MNQTPCPKHTTGNGPCYCHATRCPGCGTVITNDNAGGYQTYCLACVTAFPPAPYVPGAYNIVGTYPTFRWERVH